MDSKGSSDEHEVESATAPLPGLGDAPGLGDLAEAFFKSVGITEERYRAVKVTLHLDPKCSCADRRRWLNEVGAKLGVEGVVVKLARWMDREKGT